MRAEVIMNKPEPDPANHEQETNDPEALDRQRILGTRLRSMFDDGTQLGIAIGGWGDNAGFGNGSKSSSSRAAWAQNVAKMLDEHGFDFVGTSVFSSLDQSTVPSQFR